MVFGLFEGSVDVSLAILNYRFGERVKGTVTVKLNEPKNADALKIHLYGERQERRTSFQNGRSVDRYETVRVYQSDMELSGKTVYKDQSFPFEIQLPADPNPRPQMSPPSDMLGMVALALTQSTYASSNAPIRWFIEAHLDLPMAIDIRKKVQINVG